MSDELPEWLQAPWQRLRDSHSQGRLAHALLITGQAGVGKRLLADRLVAMLLNDGAAGDIASHPDLMVLAPEEEGKAIKVDQVRALGAELGMTSHAGGYKIALIEPADAMNVNAANSLLKTLEEPTADTLLVLLTAAPGRLPATVRSRCQHLPIATPARAQALAWLQQQGLDAETAGRCLSLAGGAPRLALALAAENTDLHDQRLNELVAVIGGRLDPLRVAADWSGAHEALTLQWWQRWLQALIRWQQAGQVPEDPRVAQMLQQISEPVDCKQLFELTDRVTRALNSLGSGLNRQLLLEDLLIDWARLAGRKRRTPRAAGR